jgi:serine/alanine adding enzyme
MTVHLKADRRQLLSEPVATFAALHPHSSRQPLAELVQLQAQQRALKRQHKEIQVQVKIISRMIGEAKRIGNSIEPLKPSMQEQTLCLRSIEDQLGDIENRILSFFQSRQNPDAETASAPTISIGRIYPVADIDISAVTVSPLQDELTEWNSYVDGNASASIYHRSEWRELIRNIFGHEGHYYLARDNQGKIIGVLPLIRLNSRLFGDFMVSMPYLMQAADKHAASLGVSHIEYRDDIPRADLPVKSDKVNMILPLADSHANLWNSLGSKLRAQIKCPQREKPQILSGRGEYLQDFYSVFARNMRDLGTPVYGKTFFRDILEVFPKNSWIIAIRLNNYPVAAGILIGHRDRLEIPWASTVRDANHLSMNMLLYWEALKFAITRGFRYFDFGRSTRGTGTFRFKQQWGAQPKQLYWHYWLGVNNELPSLNPSNPKYALLISLWKRMPVPLTKWLGPPIVKNLP